MKPPHLEIATSKTFGSLGNRLINKISVESLSKFRFKLWRQVCEYSITLVSLAPPPGRKTQFETWLKSCWRTWCQNVYFLFLYSTNSLCSRLAQKLRPGGIFFHNAGVSILLYFIETIFFQAQSMNPADKFTISHVFGMCYELWLRVPEMSGVALLSG